MFTREYHRPMYGIHGTDDVLALLDEKVQQCQERERYAFMFNPARYGLGIEEFLLILRQWQREQRTRTFVKLQTNGRVKIGLPIPRMAAVLTA